MGCHLSIDCGQRVGGKTTSLSTKADAIIKNISTIFTAGARRTRDIEEDVTYPLAMSIPPKVKSTCAHILPSTTSRMSNKPLLARRAKVAGRRNARRTTGRVLTTSISFGLSDIMNNRIERVWFL
jgi:hypothetical protein